MILYIIQFNKSNYFLSCSFSLFKPTVSWSQANVERHGVYAKQQEGEDWREGKIGREGRLRQELQLHTAEQKSLNKLYSAPSPALRYIFTTSHGRPGNSSFLDNFGWSRLNETCTFKPHILTKNFLSSMLFF